MVSTLAGNASAGYLDGPSSLAQFKNPSDICDDGFGNVYVADKNNYRIRLININTNIGLSLLLFAFLFRRLRTKKIFSLVSTYAGNGTKGNVDGPSLNAQFQAPSTLICQAAPTIFVFDSYYMRRIQTGSLNPIVCA